MENSTVITQETFTSSAYSLFQGVQGQIKIEQHFWILGTWRPVRELDRELSVRQEGVRTSGCNVVLGARDQGVDAPKLCAPVAAFLGAAQLLFFVAVMALPGASRRPSKLQVF
ncbi:hypothetical protein NDU88_006015 [Pleurodeles waltl]|uniref:Uncharacterized protein n=1 Tax=Pleurodeles waltl TaxID=8319 RepID=A0AAV7VNJ8_PLEWA|nr:hypothetical protein NDU88_006015 [Pleurodeles waltl]